jgi:hypothetical protein
MLIQKTRAPSRLMSIFVRHALMYVGASYA